ncbi:MAG TPA: hypothetical protein VH107_02760 [Lacipirellulaceae bacterium]|jgi:hypothetical protein|nr:hypothetical protein [Lacipirellulaceae bacterium]
MFVIGTGIALFIGLTGADYQQGQRTQRERDRLRSSASEFLGPDGRLDFELDGTMAVIVCDRSFDDQRFTKLANLLDDFPASDGVTRVFFGTSAGMRATPAQWRGVTDASVDVLLRWQKTLRAVAIQGTAITPAGINRLSTLPELDVSYPSRELQK